MCEHEVLEDWKQGKYRVSTASERKGEWRARVMGLSGQVLEVGRRQALLCTGAAK